MPATVTWTCDRDGTQGPSEGPAPPPGWSAVSASLTNDTGGVQTSRLALCPTCTNDLGTWLGTPVFKALPPAVPMEKP